MAILWERLNGLYVETLDEIPPNLTLVVCCLGKVLARSWPGLGRKQSRQRMQWQTVRSLGHLSVFVYQPLVYHSTVHHLFVHPRTRTLNHKL